MVEHGRHREATEVLLATIPNANMVLANALRGLADAWDKCEMGIYDAKHIPALNVQINQTLDRLGVAADNDVWEQLSQELAKGNT
jgi:hypothetical protein